MEMSGSSPVPVDGVGECKDDQQERKKQPPDDVVSPSFNKVLVAAVIVPLVLITIITSLHHYLLHFWRASGNFWQHQYHQVSLACHSDPFILFVWGTTVVGYVLYWVPGALFILMDFTGWPASLRQYKVQPGTNEPVSSKAVLKCIVVGHCNQFVVSLPVLWGSYYIMVARGGDFSPYLPSFTTIIGHLVVIIFVQEVGFYYLHRLFHHRKLYRHFHKLHHTWQSPVGIVAIYAHPLEHLIANVLPIMSGPLLMGSHPATVWLWVALATVFTIVHHSGYHLPFFPSPQYHDYHHLKFNECYGTLGILDYLHGTDQTFRSSPYYLLHRTFFTLTPPHIKAGEGKKLQ